MRILANPGTTSLDKLTPSKTTPLTVIWMFHKTKYDKKFEILSEHLTDTSSAEYDIYVYLIHEKNKIKKQSTISNIIANANHQASTSFPFSFCNFAPMIVRCLFMENQDGILTLKELKDDLTFFAAIKAKRPPSS